MKKLKRQRHFLEYFVFRIVVCVISAMPVQTMVGLCKTLGFLFGRCLPGKLTRYKVASENIRTAFGQELSDREVNHIFEQMWVHLFRMVTEIIQLPRKLRLYNCADVIHFRNRDATVQALCSGRPVIVLSGHFGNWEMAMSTFGLFGFPMGVVARDLDNPYLHEWFEKFRKWTGHCLISKKGGSDDMISMMESGGNLGMLGDQDAGSRGLFVPFFGKDASTFKSIALLALQYDAIICVGYARRLKDDFQKNRWVRYELGSEDIIDPLEYDGADAIKQMTARYTLALEKLICYSPEQYFWVHRRWKSVPRKRKKSANRAA
jgi:Kdo2-lipid IVA lauroyltransferase/acyltransferase